MTQLKSWQKTILEYLSPGNLVPESHEDWLQNGYFQKSIKELMSRDPSEVEGWAPLPGHEGIEFAVSERHHASLRDIGTGKLIGGYVYVLPYLDQEYRGRGIMAALHKQADDAGNRFTTQNYTISGFMSRAKTHALHVEDAVARGEDVPEIVLADYDIVDGKARLKEPMTRERYAEGFIERRELAARLKERAREIEESDLAPSGP